MTSLQSALNASALRQEVYANNIANASTPGYKRESVHFASMLRAELASAGLTQSESLSMAANSPRDLAGTTAAFAPVQPVVVTDSATSTSATGNNVNIDTEMAKLAQNQIDYAALVQEMNDQFSLLRTAILGS